MIIRRLSRMLWKKKVTIHHLRSYDFMLVRMVLYFIIAMILEKTQAFIGIGIFIAFIFMYKIYDKNMGNRLYIRDTPRVIKLFPGETSTLEIELKNTSYFPMVNGELKMRIGPSIRVHPLHEDNRDYWKPLRIPVSLMQNKKRTLK